MRLPIELLHPGAMALAPLRYDFWHCGPAFEQSKAKVMQVKYNFLTYQKKPGW